jgi:hypothetical protein
MLTKAGYITATEYTHTRQAPFRSGLGPYMVHNSPGIPPSSRLEQRGRVAYYSINQLAALRVEVSTFPPAPFTL